MLFIIFILVFIIVRLNKYMEILERKIDSQTVIIENVKQSFRNIMTDGSFLLDDGKIKKTIFEEDKVSIYNGTSIQDEGIEF